MIIESIVKRVVLNKSLEHLEKKKQEFAEEYQGVELEENALCRGYESDYIDNLAAANQMASMGNKSLYKRQVEAYTVYYDDHIHLNNYKMPGTDLTYEKLGSNMTNGKIKVNKNRGILTIKLDTNEKYLMYVLGSDKNKNEEDKITRQIAELLETRSGIRL